MALKTNVAGELQIHDDTFTASEDLSSSKNCVVVPSGSVSAGKTKVGLPGAQGALPMGVLLNEPASAAQAEVRMLGLAKVKANSTFNAGVEVTIAATTGKIEAASSGDYVVGIAKKAAAEANQLVTVLLTGTYQKN
jgi:hypothetical protein